jgi:hypothetical protein
MLSVNSCGCSRKIYYFFVYIGDLYVEFTSLIHDLLKYFVYKMAHFSSMYIVIFLNYHINFEIIRTTHMMKKIRNPLVLIGENEL